ncbi:hypothetical protein E4U48_002423 [Claviceps purpurea]|nr:hypothetical protein E4U12_007017 [Claviceps purpurea]KAG6158041.1 hypothetical protein E4U51_007906 [Claviceps purpurea]KAG6169282.1 hypothetical protein E4U11_004433 [Claviceps purpurea]KAG6173276.1 hypothetical protein E4U27_006833 [Claviceps purpurea]KAG6198237.1 hypothetical protein E4U10_007131 [Claviceps purpurea]
MAPVKSKKRVSDRSVTSPTRTNTKVPLKSPSTPTGPSPVKQHTIGLNAQQKQALIDNIQLEITERARRLRAQYQLQAQGLRSRIEIRINRIPMSLRKLKIGDLLQKYAQQEQSKNVSKPPPIPAKDAPVSAPQRHLLARSLPTGRGYKRMSNEISGNKENAVEHVDGTKKRARIPPVDNGRLRPGQVLSPTSSNSRLTNRDRHTSPTKSFIARPGSPLKASGTSRSAATTTANLLSSMVEKAKVNRAKGTKKMFTTSEMSTSSTSGTTAASRARRNGGATAAKAASYRPGTRNGRRASNTSETSEGSAGTVATKASLSSKAGPQTTKSSVMGSIRKGMTGGTRRAAGAAATTKSTTTPATTTAGGRVLRKRG